MIESLHKHCANCKIYTLCLDEETYDILNHLSLPNAVLLMLLEIEEYDKELLANKRNRSLIEYYFTLSPCLPLFLLEKICPTAPFICSVDADLYFFDDPSVIFSDFDTYSILITEHHFHKGIEEAKRFGRFNVSFQAFKNDEIGIKCLQHWRTQCIEWCHDYLDIQNKRFADQLYLEEWENLYPEKVKVITPNTEGIAPWNINWFKITFSNKQLCINEKPLIYYHFHGLRFINAKWVINHFHNYQVQTNSIINNYLYLPYLLHILYINKKFYIKKTEMGIRHYASPTFGYIMSQNSIFYILSKKRVIVLNYTYLSRLFTMIRPYLAILQVFFKKK